MKLPDKIDTIYIDTYSEPEVGIFGHRITINNLNYEHDEFAKYEEQVTRLKEFRDDLIRTFSDAYGEPVQVTFDFEHERAAELESSYSPEERDNMKGGMY